MTTSKKTVTAKKITLNYIPKLIINGTEIEQRAKQVTCKINNIEVNLNCCYINEIELNEAYTSSFKVTHQDKIIEVHYVKVGNRVSATIYINNTLAFSSLSMQAVFAVLNTAYGIGKSTLNNLYVKSNKTRKQANASTGNITIESTFNF